MVEYYFKIVIKKTYQDNVVYTPCINYSQYKSYLPGFSLLTHNYLEKDKSSERFLVILPISAVIVLQQLTLPFSADTIRHWQLIVINRMCSDYCCLFSRYCVVTEKSVLLVVHKLYRISSLIC